MNWSDWLPPLPTVGCVLRALVVVGGLLVVGGLVVVVWPSGKYIE